MYHSLDACVNSCNEILGWSRREYTMFPSMRGSDKGFEISIVSTVHRNGVPEMCVCIEKRRTDPYPRCVTSLFYCRNNSVLNNNIYRQEFEFLTDKPLSRDRERGFFHTP